MYTQWLRCVLSLLLSFAVGCDSNRAQINKAESFSFDLTRDNDDRLQLVLNNAPPNCFALQAAPDHLEENVQKGTWLVLSFGYFSPDDVLAVSLTVNSIQKFGDKLNVGIRPFYSYDEHKKWFPLYEEPRSPVWVIFHNGQIISHKYNPDFHDNETWSADTFTSWIRKHLPE